MQSGDQEKLAHLLWRGQSLDLPADSGRIVRTGADQGVGPRLQPQGSQEASLAAGARGFDPLAAGGDQDRGEVCMDRQVGLARVL